MKGLILAGGAGTRLRPITHTSAKQLVPIANRPILFYVVDQLAAAGIKEIGVVVDASSNEIETALGDGSRFGVEFTFIPQAQPLGLGHCVLISREFLGDDDFVVYLGDNMLQQDLRTIVDEWNGRRSPQLDLDDNARRPAASILLAHVDDPRQFGVAAIDENGRVTKLVEKPAAPPSDLALVGVYVFDATVHNAVASLTPSARGELEITDAIQSLLNDGHVVDHQVLEGWWIDTGKKDPLLHCNRLVLDTIEARIDGTLDDESRVEGRVVVDAGASLVRSVVRGPAIIGADAVLVDTYVGPYTSIGAGCELRDAQVEHSVLLERSRVIGVHHIQDSLLGRESEVIRTGERPKATRLMLGDHSRVDLE